MTYEVSIPPATTTPNPDPSAARAAYALDMRVERSDDGSFVVYDNRYEVLHVTFVAGEGWSIRILADGTLVDVVGGGKAVGICEAGVAIEAILGPPSRGITTHLIAQSIF